MCTGGQAEKSGCTRIAWAGWQLSVPENWRPLKLQGTSAKGTMMIGDAERPIMLVQWWRPDNPAFNVEKWFEQRFRKLGTVPAPNAPKPARFTMTAWQPDLATREGTSKTVWSGYSEPADLLVEVIVTSLTEERLRKAIYEKIVPGIVVAGKDEPCHWAMYNVSFVSPAGFELQRKHLYSGDIALGLARGRAESLLLRQVYPAKLAVSRRSLERWLEATPFRERRRLRIDAVAPWRHDKPRPLDGIVRTGWKRLPAPLGRCGPRHSTAVAALDKQLDRVLIAELQCPVNAGTAVVDHAMERMNEEEAG